MVLEKSRYYAFTYVVHHNAKDIPDFAPLDDVDEETAPYSIFEQADNTFGVNYMICGREHTTNIHFQGFVQFKVYLNHLQAKRALPGCFVSSMMTTPEQNILYCKKAGEYQEFGDLEEDDGDSVVFSFSKDPIIPPLDIASIY